MVNKNTEGVSDFKELQAAQHYRLADETGREVRKTTGWIKATFILSAFILGGLCTYAAMLFPPPLTGEAPAMKAQAHDAVTTLGPPANAVADALLNDAYSAALHQHPYSTLHPHWRKQVFDIAFEAGLVNILMWISESPEVLSSARQKALKERIHEVGEGVYVPFARTDAYRYRRKYYELKRHHEQDLHGTVAKGSSFLKE